MRLLIETRWFDLYLCFGMVYGINNDEWYKRALNIRLGTLATYSLRKGWRKWHA